MTDNSIWTRRKRRSRRFQFELCLALAILAAAFAVKAMLDKSATQQATQVAHDAAAR